jgi:hypothetical protein
MAQKWHKKTAQSRPSSILCRFFIETGNAHLIPYYHEILGLFKKKLGNSPKISGKNRKFGSKKAKLKL